MKRRVIVPVSLRALSDVRKTARLRRLLCRSLLGFGLLAGSLALQAQTLTDRLDVPARVTVKAAESSLNALAVAGTRLIAAGQRGHILWSDDGSSNWYQSQVPVSSDLTAVQFVDARHGWAVGHDGVILHSRDGGESWQLQLDGHRIAELLSGLAAGLDPEQHKRVVLDLERAAAQGVDQSLLGLHFRDANNGIVIGASNLVLRTRDGGKSWQVISDKVDNPRGLHLYGIQEAFGRLFIVGEQGLILRQATGSEDFESLASPYQGSWFGALGSADRLLVYGLLGNAWLSRDGGVTWQQSELDSSVAITSASVVGASELVMVSLGGEVFRSSDGGGHFEHLDVDQRYPFFAVAPDADSALVVAGIRGVQAVTSKRGVQP
ncbi:YCF48-related protein [Pseudomonas aeruginosa]|uniref:WD40/YVTN/BNR-like repeat-containing protein n=1 Tax=Pseudomonas aeruginosa TaxID=287 RepID=UPI0031B72A7D